MREAICRHRTGSVLSSLHILESAEKGLAANLSRLLERVDRIKGGVGDKVAATTKEKLFAENPEWKGEFAEQIIDCSPYPARAIAFNRDFTRLYFGTLSGNGVYGVDLDANLDPIGDPVLIRAVPDSWHDTVEVDACGHIYVGSVFSSSIFRINADLSVTEIIDWTFNTYGHGFEWGDETGGWDPLSIYVTHPYIGSRVDTFYLGVPGAHWPGTVIGGFTL